MAKINMPRQTIFPDPGIVQRAQSTGVAGLPERIEAQQVGQTISAIQQATNFVQNAVSFGVDIDNLLNQNAAGEFEVAKAQAESRLIAEQQRATEPEPLAERLTQKPGEAPPVGPGAPPMRVQDDMELYEERFPEMLTDINDIGKELKGRARKAYDMWVQTQAPGWQGAMHGMYTQRVEDNTKTKYNIVVSQNINIGNPVEVQRLYTEAIDNGVWSFAEIGEQMQADISAAALSKIESDAIAIADEQGYDAANDFLDKIRSNEDEDYKAVNSLLSNEQLEDIRKTVRLRLSDKFEQDERIYKKQVLEPTESQANELIDSYTWGTGVGPEDIPATSGDARSFIMNSDMRGPDKRKWLGYLDAIIESKAKGITVSDPAIENMAMAMSVDTQVTPSEFHTWRMGMVQEGKLTHADASKYYSDKKTNFEEPAMQIKALVLDAHIKSKGIDEFQAARVSARVDAWLRTPAGQDEVTKNPDAVEDKTIVEIGKVELEDVNAQVEGFDNRVKKSTTEFMNQIVKDIRAPAVRVDDKITQYDQPLQITNSGKDDTFYMTTVSLDYDRTSIERILRKTGFLVSAWGQNTAGVEGYIANTNPSARLFDVFRLSGNNVEFWDSDSGKWKTFKDINQFNKQRNVKVEE